MKRTKTAPLVVGALVLAISTTNAIDDDGDGVSDVFQSIYGVPTAELDLDRDGDGYTNREEAAFATDPNDAASRFRPLLDLQGPALLRYSWSGFPDVRYQLRSSGNLQAWVDVGSLEVGDGSVVVRDVAVLPQPMFFRVEVSGTAGTDLDGDTLDLYEETLLGTDPSASDTDDDGLTDFEEFDGGLTDPVLADTNGDGVWDGTSLGILNGGGLDPAASDVDGDGLSNAAERALGTDPFHPDTDRDGFNDDVDEFPLDPTRHELPAGSAGDTTPPQITLTAPASATPL